MGSGDHGVGKVSSLSRDSNLILLGFHTPIYHSNPDKLQNV